MSKKLAAKAGLIQIPAAQAPEPVTTSHDQARASRPRTAPGSMLHFMSHQSAAIKEAEQLRDQLAQFDGAQVTKKLDPATVRSSRWANRDEASYQTAEFNELKNEIAAAGGNIQPIKVRPVPGQDGHFEIVFGHRRHRACLELGLSVLATIESVTDQTLFEQMERENRSRKDLSAWEQGIAYLRALDEGLYPSNRKLAEAIGRDLGDVGKAISLGRLPRPIVDAFDSPLDLQFRWAKPLNDALQADPEGLLRRAKQIAKAADKLPAAQVFKRLVEGRGVGPSNPPIQKDIRANGAHVATLEIDRRGRTTIAFAPDINLQGREDHLVKLIQEFLVGAQR